MTISADRYKDLDFSLEKSDINGFRITETQETISQSVSNLILTRVGFATKYEQPELGSNIYNLLSQKPTRFVALQIKDQIELSLENYEPRIEVRKVSIDFDSTNNAFLVEIFYTIISLSLNDTLQLNLKLIQ